MRLGCELDVQDEAGGPQGGGVVPHARQPYPDRMHRPGPEIAGQMLRGCVSVDLADEAEARPGKDDLVQVEQADDRAS